MTKFSSSNLGLKEYALSYIKGSGIEIGALHNPIILNGGDASVLYLDRLPKEELKKQYPELTSDPCDVDIIDDGEVLSKIHDNSLDFIVASNFLEHCKNPIGTIFNHLQKVKLGGLIYYVVPDKRFTFDKEREVTEYLHLIADFTSPTEHFEHYIEWAETCNNLKGEAAKKQAQYLFDMDYSIHFHTFTSESLLGLFPVINNKQSFEIELFGKCGIEIVVILKKTKSI